MIVSEVLVFFFREQAGILRTSVLSSFMAVNPSPFSPPASLSWRNFALFAGCFDVANALEVYGRKHDIVIKTWHALLRLFASKIALEH